MNTLNGKHIILGITGGIAAYKSAELTRRLRDAGALVRVVMTRSAKGRGFVDVYRVPDQAAGAPGQ